ncbi:RNA-binding protein [Aliiroseovarius crassostreae]|uniref:RNA-binding protein n=1 Tax=Aliiroseovarius crassostreae TaxID=154981 RepID=UPI002209B69E|nr:RNA-binding protein [Aliiroseovarius crassostreae]UWQ07825.1 RNA-binding protein [Aliiroseovarius crassostreae]
MTRGGSKSRPQEPERKCIATGESQPKTGLIRFVVGPDGMVVPDLLGKLPGRGIYVAANRAAIATAIKKGLFSRAARQPVTVPDGLLDLLEKGYADRVVHLIAMARKAGQAVAGYEKVKDWLAKDEAKVLIQAIDGSDRQKSKLRPPRERDRYINCLTGDELGLAFGRENVIHGALAAGGLASRVVEEAKKLTAMRALDSGGDKGHRKGTKTR